MEKDDIVRLGFKRLEHQSRGGRIGLAYDDLEVLDFWNGIAPHRHENYYEIVWFTEGTGHHFVEFVAHEIKPNMLFFIGKTQIHAFDPKQDIKGHMLRFDESLLYPSPGNGMEPLEHSIYKLDISPFHFLTSEQAESFAVLVNQIRGELASPDTHRKKELLSYYLKIFLIEIERLAPPQNYLESERLELLTLFHEFTSLLELHFKEHYRVAEYADLMGMSTKRLTEICHKVAGAPTKKIIDERMVMEAKRLLSHSSLRIKEICYALGFDDPAYFSKFFKNATNMSPQAYRQSPDRTYDNA